jgi:periplasmic protein TonB
MTVRNRFRPGNRRRPRAPRADVFANLVLDIPTAPRLATRRAQVLLVSLILFGILAGALWRPQTEKVRKMDDTFVFEEEAPPPPPPPKAEPPPPPKPPPRVKPPPKPKAPPPPQFGLEEKDNSKTGELAVATGNTIMKEAEKQVAPPPPPLPTAPVMMDQAPRILKGKPPKYPAHALDRGLEGTVVALITIDTNGRVTKFEIERSAGREFDNAVNESIGQTSFQPQVRNGRRMPVRFRRPYVFKLGE